MGLSAEEKQQLDALTKKSKEPDAPPPSVNFNLDLSSDTAWERARKLGLVPGDDDNNNDDNNNDDDNKNSDDPPRRRGYFPDN